MRPRDDRSEASRVRYGARRAAALETTLAQLRSSPEYAAMRRFARIHGALDAVLPEHAKGKIRAISVKDGTCTLAVADGVLCAELRSTCARKILNALAEAGTGTTRLAWRIERPRR